MKYRFLVMSMKAGPNAAAPLRYFGYVNGKRFVHWFGPSRMPLDQEYTVLRDYGLHDPNDSNVREILGSRYARDFPWPRDLRAGAGWLSPDGVFYPCESWEHDHAANMLAWEHGWPGLATQHMERTGWLRIGNTSVIRMYDNKSPTQRQIDTLFDLSQLPGQTERLVEDIMYTIKEAE